MCTAARRAAEERADKMALELSRSSDQLRLVQENYNNAESLRKQLEVQIREITIRLDEAESTKDGKKPLAKLQARVGSNHFLVPQATVLTINSVKITS
jgi:hypothetical protein